jgi:hypothetical protein
VDNVAKEIPTTVNKPVPEYMGQTKGRYLSGPDSPLKVSYRFKWG